MGESSTEDICPQKQFIHDTKDLREIGVVKVPIPSSLLNQRHALAERLAEITPLNAASEDGEYAFYRNIMEDPDFPFDSVLAEGSEIGNCIRQDFLGDDHAILDEVIERDDAFCISYNTTQDDTTCAKHMDPSDITVNICLFKSDDCEGSRVMFYGKSALTPTKDMDESNRKDDDDDTIYVIDQTEGYATIHWGHHPHETEPLKRGVRTNIILTFKYKDESKSGVISRTCYATF